MVRSLEILQVYLLAVSIASCENIERRGRRKNDFGDKSLWKKEHESELNDALMSNKRRQNKERVMLSASVSENEAMVEKLMETILSSEKYFKKVDSIDFRLNRLDTEVHEKSNNIIKNLAELSKLLRNDRTDKLKELMQTLQSEVQQIKLMIDTKPLSNVEGSEYHMDPAVESRLTVLDSQTKNIMAGVESIVAIISEVKNRQYNSRTFHSRSDLGYTLDTVSLVNEFRKTLQSRKCDCSRMDRMDRYERYPTDCQEIQMQGFNISGIYKIKPEDMEPFYVLCDLTTAGGAWTVFQNRFDGSQDFYKGWSDYKHGFGNLAGEFWLGLEKLNILTNQKLYELRIELEAQQGQEVYAGYSVFTIGPEHEGFRISTLGTYYGTAGDSLTYHAGQKFSTLDADNDEWKDGACAKEHGGAWWYKGCDKSNLNGKYSMTAYEHRGQAIYWISFKETSLPISKTKMMIRPLPPSRPNEYTERNRVHNHNLIAK